MKVTISLLLILNVLFFLSSCNNQDPWQPLFNGKNLDEWNQKGGNAKFEVVNGQIIGTTVWEDPNSFLCTNEAYGDFILEFEVKIDDYLNSGVQFRSKSLPEYLDGRVHGYQCELDPTDRAWTGGIYEEAKRGWLYPLDYNQEAKSAYKNDEWNKIRIEAIGNHIKTWVNGVSAANLWDERVGSGFIALQVHHLYDSVDIGKEVRWKNIRVITENPREHVMESTAPELSRLVNRLTPHEKENDWELLFDGNSIENWRGAHQDSFPSFGWKVHDGILTVLESGGAEAKHGGDIVSKKEYGKFDLVLEFKITPGANSGIKYYVTESEKTKGSAIGLEYQILDDKLHPDANLGNHQGSRTLASLYDLIKAENKRFYGPGNWTQARVYSDGSKIEHWLNGIKVLEYNRFSPEFDTLVSESKYAKWESFGKAKEGHILLQDHGNRVSFRSIKIKAE